MRSSVEVQGEISLSRSENLERRRRVASYMSESRQQPLETGRFDSLESPDRVTSSTPNIGSNSERWPQGSCAEVPTLASQF